jgi:hypothetical protein
MQEAFNEPTDEVVTQVIEAGRTPPECSIQPRSGTRHDTRGLFFCLDPVDRITAITAASATIGRISGSALRFYRRADDTGAVLAWSLGTSRR